MLQSLTKTALQMVGESVLPTIGASMGVLGSRAVKTTAYDVGSSTNIKWHEGMVSRADKEKILNQKGCVLWFTGLSGSGKSTVACTLEHALKDLGTFFLRKLSREVDPSSTHTLSSI